MGLLSTACARRWRAGSWFAPSVLLAVLAACGADNRRVVYDDEGALCWRSYNGELSAHVALPNCLSSSCDTDRVAQCTVLVEDARVRLDSHLAYTVQGSGSCTFDCGRLVADCATPLPADGTYAVDFGQRLDVATLSIVAGAVQGGSTADCSATF